MSVSDYISSLSDISQELEGTPDEVTERYLIMRIFATLPSGKNSASGRSTRVRND